MISARARDVSLDVLQSEHAYHPVINLSDDRDKRETRSYGDKKAIVSCYTVTCSGLCTSSTLKRRGDRFHCEVEVLERR